MSFHTAALLADSINDASSTRKVYLLAAGLALLGIALVLVTVWFWRSTRHDPELLAPLEVMGARRFRRLESSAQQQTLDRSRPADAKPMRWGVVRGEASSDSEIDLRESTRAVPGGYDDLRDPALIAVALESPEGDVAPTADDVAEPHVDAAVGAAVAGATAVEPVGAAVAPAAERDPLAEIDALLAATATPAALAPLDDSVKPADAAVPTVVAADDIAAEAADPHLVAVADAPAAAASRPRGSKPGAPREVVPLVIVPVDHELRPSAKRPDPAPAEEPQPVDDTAATEQPEVEEPVSIDPLLRMVNRNDG